MKKSSASWADVKSKLADFDQPGLICLVQDQSLPTWYERGKRAEAADRPKVAQKSSLQISCLVRAT